MQILNLCCAQICIHRSGATQPHQVEGFPYAQETLVFLRRPLTTQMNPLPQTFTVATTEVCLVAGEPFSCFGAVPSAPSTQHSNATLVVH